MNKIRKRCEACNEEFECWAYAADRRKTCSRKCKNIQLKLKEKAGCRCIVCNETDLEKFYEGRKASCKSCHNNKLIEKRKDMLHKGREILGGKCSKCGYNKCDAALEFHHVIGSKEFQIAGAKYGWKRMKAEIEKCILLCANCHREHHNIK